VALLAHRNDEVSMKNILIAVGLGVLFAAYLYIADAGIPAPRKTDNHYNVGNSLVGAMFFSYSGFAFYFQLCVSILMYIAYSYVALFRLRKIGIRLFFFHYMFAFFVSVPYYICKDADLISDSMIQLRKLYAQPGVFVFCLVPFIVLNLIYLWRVLGGPRSDQAQS
jgi:hypothetical protein